MLLCVPVSASAQAGASSEYQVKAVFLFNFAQFVEWPASAFTERGAPIVIGVLGENPFGSYLDDTVRGEHVADRPLQVQQYRRVEDIKTCHVLFISRSEVSRLDTIFASLKGRPTLVVGEGDDFVKRGGTIGLASADNKIRLVVNVEAAAAANLTISSKLLRSAQLVSGAKR
jgi:hypothetical protein